MNFLPQLWSGLGKDYIVAMFCVCQQNRTLPPYIPPPPFKISGLNESTSHKEQPCGWFSHVFL